MPRVPFTSGKEILARVVRALSYKLPSVYYDDILEWIPEGMGYLQVTNALELKYSGDEDCPDEIYVRNYCASLPCGFIAIERVDDEHGCQVYESSSILGSGLIENTTRPNVFMVDPFVHQTSDGTTGPPTEHPNIVVTIQGGDIVSASGSSQGYYNIVGNKIQTSFECGYIRMAYWAIPTCKDGYPMIPDNENYKQALEWHIIRRLIGSGYEHKIFSYQYADEQFEKFAARGMNEVSYYSPDQAARLARTMVRLIPPNSYNNYFV